MRNEELVSEERRLLVEVWLPVDETTFRRSLLVGV